MIRSMEEFTSAFHAARCVSTPLVAVGTADPASATHFVIETLKHGRQLPPLLGWDVARGLYAIGRDSGEELPRLVIVKAVDALIGLAAFPAEQALAISLVKRHLDTEDLWERKRQIIEQTPGLAV